MARLTWVATTPVDVTNLSKLTQDEDLKPIASTFAGSSAGRTITHNYGHTNYQVVINPAADAGGLLGEVWVVKAANTVVIYNSGSAVSAFDYTIIPHA
jgi:hypothetical protein